MKRITLFLIFLVLCSTELVFSQESNTTRQNNIRGGFYLKAGAVLPVGSYATTQFTPMNNQTQYGVASLSYLPAKIGAAMDMGYLIYIGPAFANNLIRAGMDATFMSFSFNSTSAYDQNKKYEHYYYFGGQKFGPLVTINPVDRLMIDLSYKINANFSYYFGEWHDLSTSQFSKYGKNLFMQEISMSVRYRIMVMSFQYNFGNMNYDNFDNTRTKQTINANTFRILFGVKF
ncbi:MAG: hypothetical protein PHF97_09500 [Bacteroidales bacterium]|nr:hypothetical protein [Bacteroidales bacterium]MDD4604026.1 hypothetical protein [Bacteroidales bacterium]